jgi:rhodanese-related sulfurtransferase
MDHAPEFLKLVDEAKSRVKEISVEDAKKRVQEDRTVILIDVREDNEWQAGHARSALHIGKGVIERDIEKAVPDAKKKIVLYCGGGFRSALAADALQKMGYENVYSLAGGWRAWKEDKMPIETND